MQPIKFEEANTALRGGPAAKFGSEREVLDLPVYKDGRQIVSCWRMTWRERFSALMFGRVWVGVLSPNTAPPIWLNAKKTVFQENSDGR